MHDDITSIRVQVVLEVQVERNVQDTSLSIVVLLDVGELGLGQLLVLIQHILRLVDGVTRTVGSDCHVRIYITQEKTKVEKLSVKWDGALEELKDYTWHIVTP